ncbi:ApeP family dehydratase [Shewanella cyperi]|uniref:ApeP family dehydratase n=1 Tax=Shewanella cyperi TaxID=2814292 RepID=UPI001A93BD73|nr:hotdog family protein [Shewanella cyperi]QSX40663.1 hotdog family protein [Shewanella cyperi]
MTDAVWQTPPLAELPIETFIPHRAPMVLIDRALEHRKDFLETQVCIDEQSPFFDGLKGGVPNYVGIEYMAQSIAALAGIEAKLAGLPVRIGFLLGSRKLQLHQGCFLAGHEYRVRVQRLYQEDTGLAVFDCQILEGETVVASANINVFQPDDALAYIAESRQD